MVRGFGGFAAKPPYPHPQRAVIANPISEAQSGEATPKNIAARNKKTITIGEAQPGRRRNKLFKFCTL
jgi:hypothetical protein